MRFMICLVMLLCTCGYVDARIDYGKQYEFEYKTCSKKSWRKIIREVLDKRDRKIERVLPKRIEENTIPIPLYDSIDWDKLKNLA